MGRYNRKTKDFDRNFWADLETLGKLWSLKMEAIEEAQEPWRVGITSFYLLSLPLSSLIFVFGF